MNRQIRRQQVMTAVLMFVLLLGCVGIGIYHHVNASRETESTVQTVRRLTTQVANRSDAMILRGLGSVGAMDALLEEMDGAGKTVFLFVSSYEAEAARDSLKAFAEKNVRIGLTYDALAGTTENAMVSEIDRYARALDKAVGYWPEMMLVSAQPSENLLRAAETCGIRMVYVQSDSIALSTLTDVSRLAAYEEASKENIIALTLSGADQADAAIAASALLHRDIRSDDYEGIANRLMLKEYDMQAEPLRQVYTTQDAVAYTFSGISSSKELPSVLAALKQCGATALFYITREEASSCEEAIRSILEAGHDLGILVVPGQYADTVSQLTMLLELRAYLQENYGYDKELPVRLSYGSPSAILYRAAGGGGFRLLSSLVDVVRTDMSRMTDASKALEKVLPEARGVLQKGSIVHFQMGLFQYSHTMLGEMVKLVSRERNIYQVCSPLTLWSNTEETYAYPIAEENRLPEVRGKIYPGQLKGKNTMDEIANRYIGIDWVNLSAFLPGFTSKEIRRLDKKGLVSNDKKQVFLTFDDWGTDRTIIRLLDVLEKHGAKGTFFVRTEHVLQNPNLLRTIAVRGHSIGSHTHTHFPLSNDISGGRGKKFEELSAKELAAFQQDILTSFETLAQTVGDVAVDGKPALTLLFRPPTLAVGKASLITVLDCGFSYSVSGSYTTQDYKAKNAETLARKMVQKTRSGAVLIMHMSDNSIYTADALDAYLTQMEKKDYVFVGLDEALRLQEIKTNPRPAENRSGHGFALRRASAFGSCQMELLGGVVAPGLC